MFHPVVFLTLTLTLTFQSTAATLGGWTTLHNACCYGHLELTKDLLALGMDPSEATLVRRCCKLFTLPHVDCNLERVIGVQCITQPSWPLSLPSIFLSAVLSPSSSLPPSLSPVLLASPAYECRMVGTASTLLLLLDTQAL